ncbi:cobalamin-binding protein [Candidatus Thorarchaeota archaeon]|nr:MAG: cobalamin-binding protein [Candidatus Thorarchaeota archaeon]
MAAEADMHGLIEAIVEGNREATTIEAEKALESGIPPFSIVIDGCSKAMSEVGDLYQNGEYFIPEMLMSAKAFEAAMAVIKPKLKDADIDAKGTIVIGTCKGDIHSLGKNLVASMLDAAGFNVIDLGEDVPLENFGDTALKQEADIVAVSALMTTSMDSMKKVIEDIHERKIPVKTLVGGGPITPEFADSIRADGYAKDAQDAVRIAAILAK